jgi:hypothetical protein
VANCFQDLEDVNYDSRLYTLRCGEHGYSFMGFDYVEKLCKALSEELGVSGMSGLKPGRAQWEACQELIKMGREKSRASGWKSKAALTPQLEGLEGKRVEVETMKGEKRKFIVGKSTGWMPCHLEINTWRSRGGGGVSGAPFKSVKVLNDHQTIPRARDQDVGVC